MTKYNFRFKSLTSVGEIVDDVVTFDCPDFQDKEVIFTLNGKSYTHIVSVETQLMSWLDNQDKKDLMYDKDWYGIIDYELEKPKSKDTQPMILFELAKNYFATLEHNEQLFVDFTVVYGRLYDKLKDLPLEQQFSLVLESLNIGYESKTDAYRNMLGLLRDDGKNLKIELGDKLPIV